MHRVGYPLAARSQRRNGAAMPNHQEVTVLTVDDQVVFRRAARSLIAATPGFEQVGEAASGREALELTAELRPDLVLLDVRMPGMDGIETARRLADSDPEAMVVLISIEEVSELPSSVASAGAAAVMRKRDLSTRSLRKLWRTHRPRTP
jgi:two-component system, NarL family, invasion response regulator UvrY